MRGRIEVHRWMQSRAVRVSASSRAVPEGSRFRQGVLRRSVAARDERDRANTAPADTGDSSTRSERSGLGASTPHTTSAGARQRATVTVQAPSCLSSLPKLYEENSRQNTIDAFPGAKGPFNSAPAVRSAAGSRPQLPLRCSSATSSARTRSTPVTRCSTRWICDSPGIRCGTRVETQVANGDRVRVDRLESLRIG